jgi:uroporphyrinogen-III synthase
VQILPPADEGAIDAVLRRLGEFDLVAFTSANGVASFVERAGRLGLDARAMPHSALAAIGPATAEALRRHFLRPDVLPTEFTTSALAAAIGEWMKTSRDAARFSPSTRAKNPDYIGTLPVAPNPDVTSVRRVLLARADIATPELAASLRAMTGVVVEEVSFYRTVPATELPAEAAEALRAGRVDWITFTSSSCVRGLLALAESQHLLGAVRSAKLAAIGPVTARTLRDAGLEPAFIASPHTVEGLVEGIVTNSPNDNSQ